MSHYDHLETRSADERHAAQDAALRDLHGFGLDALAGRPVLRKSELAARQAEAPPFGDLRVGDVGQMFQSPGPIYEPGGFGRDWWRMGRFLHACGIGPGDVVQNCFGYHLTPAGHMFESGARAVGARVLPAGTGQTDLQVRAAADIRTTAYAGTPDYLKVILDRADEMGVALHVTRAAVGGGALFPSLRAEYAERGVACLQCYATADLGNVAYESPAQEGMILEEGAIVEIVRPGTGDALAPGEVGEVVVTVLNPDYPLVRFATGDLSAILPGASPCGRTNARIQGWMGRADQTTKVKGMFVRPEQVAELVARHAEIRAARAIVTREGEMDALTLAVVAEGGDEGAWAASAAEVLKLRARVERVGTLPNDGLVIEDRRDYG